MPCKDIMNPNCNDEGIYYFNFDIKFIGLKDRGIAIK